MNPHRLGVLAVVLGATIWSTGGLCIKLLPFDPFTILFYRSVFAALTFLAVFRRKALTLTPVIATVGLEYAGLAICFVVATKITTAANAVLLQYTAPIYVFLLEPVLLEYYFLKRTSNRVRAYLRIPIVRRMVNKQNRVQSLGD